MKQDTRAKKKKNSQPLFSGQFDSYLNNLSMKAALDDRMPFIGREKELEAVMETLLRRLKNNVILVGRPGVGKTAFITSMAARMAGPEAPSVLRDKVVLELSVNAFFHAQESYKAVLREFQALIAEIRRHGSRVILFLDEIVIRLMTGGDRHQNVIHLQNLLKNSISRKEFTLIAATTPEDYYRFIKNDDFIGANANTVFMEEPDRREVMKILAGIQPYFSNYYQLEIPSSLFSDLFELALRFIPHRAFPDKVVELLDSAAAKAALKRADKLKKEHVYQSVADITRLACEVIRRDPGELYEGLFPFLRAGIINQEQALLEIARVLKLSYLQSAEDQQRPQAIFLFLGPPGTGKSFVAERIAEYFFADCEKLRTIDMAEFGQAESVEKLLFDRASGRDGVLLREVEAHPFSVLLLENVQEAHSSVLYFIGETLKRGEIVDRVGGRHSLSRIIVILSLTRIGVEMREQAIGFFAEGRSRTQVIIAPEIMSLLDWVDEIIEFTPLDRAQLVLLVENMLKKLVVDFKAHYNCRLSFSKEVALLAADLAFTSGRFAHTLSEFVERRVKVTAVDVVTRQGHSAALHFLVEHGEIKVEALKEKRKKKAPRVSAEKNQGKKEG